MSYKITETKVHIEDEVACAAGLQNEIVAVLDSADDLTSLGVNWYPMSIAIISDPYSVKVLSASRIWKDKQETGGGGGGSSLPSYGAGDAGKGLHVNSTGDGLEWKAQTTPTVTKDWAENNPSSPNYIQNRSHYSYQTPVMSNTISLDGTQTANLSIKLSASAIGNLYIKAYRVADPLAENEMNASLSVSGTLTNFTTTEGSTHTGNCEWQDAQDMFPEYSGVTYQYMFAGENSSMGIAQTLHAINIAEAHETDVSFGNITYSGISVAVSLEGPVAAGLYVLAKGSTVYEAAGYSANRYSSTFNLDTKLKKFPTSTMTTAYSRLNKNFVPGESVINMTGAVNNRTIDRTLDSIKADLAAGCTLYLKANQQTIASYLANEDIILPMRHYSIAATPSSFAHDYFEFVGQNNDGRWIKIKLDWESLIPWEVNDIDVDVLWSTIPTFDSSDQGKFLSIDQWGDLEWVSVPSANGVSF